MPTKSERLSQVFLKDSELVTSLVNRSSVGPNDLVLEIGPGTGIITDQLLKKAGKVIAVEKDFILFSQLIKRYANNSRIELYHGDILDLELPKEDYKVFSNIPFAIEGKLVRRLLKAEFPPTDAYLVMRREVAERMAGIPRKSLFSILHEPWFDLEIFHRFERNDFRPKPKVESVIFRFRRKRQPLIKEKNAELYKLLVRQGFGGGRRIRQNLAIIFSFNKLKQLARNHGFNINNKPSDLTLEQWLVIFKSVNESLSESQKRKLKTKVLKLS